MSRSKAARPETLAQAVVWDTVRSRYYRDGFCDVCAAQAAWGHQLGFSNAKPVCDRCRGVVPTFRHANARALRWAEVPIAAASHGQEYGAQHPGAAEAAGHIPALETTTDVDGNAMTS